MAISKYRKVWENIWGVFKKDAECKPHIQDSTTAKARQHASGGVGGKELHAIVDGLGYPIEILLTGTDVHNSVSTADFIRGKKPQYFIDDKASDSNAIRNEIFLNGSEAARYKKTMQIF